MTIQAMSNISSQASVSQTPPASGLRQDLRGLESALLNGDLSGAQSAFATLQQVIGGIQNSANSTSIASQLGQSGSPLGQDLQAVSSALGANDIGAAQKAFAKLQQDMQSTVQANRAAHAHHGHHAHHAKANDGDADGASASSTSPVAAMNTLLQSMSSLQSSGSSANDLLTALQSLASSNPKVASDLSALMADMSSTGAVVNTKA